MATIKELAEQAGLEFNDNEVARVDEDDLERFAELIRQDEREAVIRVIKYLSPEIVGKANDPNTYEQWCYSATQFSRFESVIAAIKARSNHETS